MNDLRSRLLELLEYRDGQLFWKVNKNRASAGQRAGSLGNDGYHRVKVDKVLHLEHRLIFLLFNKYLPSGIDHIDGNTENNKIENLRPCNQSQNTRNSKLSKANSSGVKGVSWKKDRGKWCVCVNVGGRNKYFGHYRDLELAELVANEAREHYHGEFFRHG